MTRTGLWSRLWRREAPLSIDERFASLAEWRAYYSANPWLTRREALEPVARRIEQNGFIEPFTQRRVTPREIAATTGNWREELLAHYPAKFTWTQLRTFVNSGYDFLIRHTFLRADSLAEILGCSNAIRSCKLDMMLGRKESGKNMGLWVSCNVMLPIFED